MKNKSLREGSYTVEAAVIMSLLLLILATILVWALCLHDRALCLFKSLSVTEKARYCMEEPIDTEGRLTEGLLLKKEKEEDALLLEIERELLDFSEESLLYGSISSAGCRRDKDRLILTYYFSFPSPGNGGILLYREGMEGSRTISRDIPENPEGFLRRIRGILRGSEREGE